MIGLLIDPARNRASAARAHRLSRPRCGLRSPNEWGPRCVPCPPNWKEAPCHASCPLSPRWGRSSIASGDPTGAGPVLRTIEARYGPDSRVTLLRPRERGRSHIPVTRSKPRARPPPECRSWSRRGDGIVTLTPVVLPETMSGYSEPIRQSVDRVSPSAKWRKPRSGLCDMRPRSAGGGVDGSDCGCAREDNQSPGPDRAIQVVASCVLDAVSDGVSFRPGCSDIGFADVQSWEGDVVAPRHNFVACPSRSRAARIEGP